MTSFEIPDWDTYFMALAFTVSSRSPDPVTKHGCVFVDKYHHPIAFGYNGYPSGSDDKNMPKERPLKYLVTLHSEDNAILNKIGDLKGSTVYITGDPCLNCWCRLIQVRVSRVVIGPIGSACVNENDQKIRNLLLENQNIQIDYYDGLRFLSLFDSVREYVKRKLEEKTYAKN